jgi:hypothetical protein
LDEMLMALRSEGFCKDVGDLILHIKSDLVVIQKIVES